MKMRLVKVAVLSVAVLLTAVLFRGAAIRREREHWEAIKRRVEGHIHLVHQQLQELLASMCPSDQVTRVPSPWEQARGDINVPSCSALRDAGLEAYYGNLNMLLVEAWIAKILPSLEARAQPRTSAELLTISADGEDPAGAIFVQQLQLGGAAVPAAMMIGIHRLPRHKAMRRLHGRAPAVLITDALVGRVVAWCTEHRIARLFVCPYAELRDRLRVLGFAPVASQTTPAYVFGEEPVWGTMCEEAQLYVHEVPLR